MVSQNQETPLPPVAAHGWLIEQRTERTVLALVAACAVERNHSFPSDHTTRRFYYCIGYRGYCRRIRSKGSAYCLRDFLLAGTDLTPGSQGFTPPGRIATLSTSCFPGFGWPPILGFRPRLAKCHKPKRAFHVCLYEFTELGPC